MFLSTWCPSINLQSMKLSQHVNTQYVYVCWTNSSIGSLFWATRYLSIGYRRLKRRLAILSRNFELTRNILMFYPQPSWQCCLCLLSFCCRCKLWTTLSECYLHTIARHELVTPAADIQSELIAEYVNAAPSIRTFFEGSLKLNRHFRVSEDVTSKTSSGIYPIKILYCIYDVL